MEFGLIIGMQRGGGEKRAMSQLSSFAGSDKL